MKRLLVWILAAAAAAGCSAPVTRVELVTLDAGLAAAGAARLAPGLHVARSENEWQALWRELSASQVPPPAAPVIDFARRTVLCVALGERRSGGYAVEIRAVERRGDAFVVRARETRPTPGSMQIALLTAPVALATIDATSLPLELVLEP